MDYLFNQTLLTDNRMIVAVRLANELKRYCMKNNIPKDAVISGVAWDFEAAVKHEEARHRYWLAKKLDGLREELIKRRSRHGK